MSAMDGVITQIKKVLDDMKYNDNDNDYRYEFITLLFAELH